MVLLVSKQFNSGPKLLETLALSVYQIHQVVRESFEQREPLERPNIDYSDESLPRHEKQLASWVFLEPVFEEYSEII